MYLYIKPLITHKMTTKWFLTYEIEEVEQRNV